MKAISVRQPWASLIISGAKRIETRSWPAPKAMWGQRILVHSSANWSTQECALTFQEPFKSALGITSEYPLTLPFGSIIGSVSLVECKRVEALTQRSWEEDQFGNFDPGRWGWVLCDPAPLSEPIAARGRLGFWSFPGIISHSVEYREVSHA